MTTQEYCEMVEKKERRRKQLFATQRIQEDQSALVSLKDSGFNLMFEPSIKEDCDYRVREAVYGKIGRISQRLAEQGDKLIIRSVWRSFGHQRLLWEEKYAIMQQKYPHKHADEVNEIVSRFIAPPTKSMHATGGSVDALIFDVKNDRVRDFGNNVGLKLELDETCYPHHPDLSPVAQQNRKVLMDLFEDEDFVVDILEYWHFDYGNASWATEKGKEYARYGVIEELVK